MFEFDKRGYREGKNYGNGIIRFGRKAKQSPIINDIYFGSKMTEISRRQFMIFYKKSYGFRICDTSNSNPLQWIFEPKRTYLLTQDKIINIGEQISLIISEIKHSGEFNPSQSKYFQLDLDEEV